MCFKEARWDGLFLNKSLVLETSLITEVNHAGRNTVKEMKHCEIKHRRLHSFTSLIPVLSFCKKENASPLLEAPRKQEKRFTYAHLKENMSLELPHSV